MPIVIYKTSVSPPARATLMVAHILKLIVKTVEVNLPTREHYKSEYLAKNPLHTVPLLEDGDFLLADSHAIITYLVTQYGSSEYSNLYPTNTKIRATIDQRLYFDATILFPRLRTVIYSLVRGNPLSDNQRGEIIEAYGFLEKYLELSTFLVGDSLTLADVSCVATISSLNSIVPVQLVKVNEWWNKLKTEDWYVKENIPGVVLFDGFIKQFLRQ